MTTPLLLLPVKPRPVLISAIDHAASAALTQREGHCPAAGHGLHSVLHGTAHCRLCGCR